MATITKTDSGKWKSVIRRSGWPTVSKTFRVKRDAEDWSRATEDEIIRGIYIPRSHSEKMTVARALDRYLKEVTPTKKPTTQVREKGRAKQLKSSLGKYSLAALNADKIGAFRDARLAEGKSASTIRLELALLSHLYSVAIKEWGLGLIANPVLNVRKPAPSKGRNRRLTDREEEKLLKECDAHSNPFFGWIVRIALYTAMRQGEIVGLTKNQVNLRKRTVTLTDTKNDTVRTVPLSNKALEVLEAAMAHSIRPIDTKLLFYGEPGRDGIRRPYTINRTWVHSLEAAGIQGLRFHDLRHEATSRLVEAGLSDQQVSSITGHKSMQMLKRYTHLRTENLADLIADL